MAVGITGCSIIMVELGAITEFCKDSEHIYCETRMDDLIAGNLIIDPAVNEIYRSRWCTDGSCIFDLRLNIVKGTGLSEQIRFMKTIELFYPKRFSWRFDGQYIQALGIIPLTKENLGILSRYGGFAGFIKHLRKRLSDVLKFRDFMEIHHLDIIDDKLLSNGSINIETNLYAISIDPSWTTQIMENCLTQPSKSESTITLDMKYWVREVNPDFFKEARPRKGKKWALSDDIFDKYPVAIKNITKLKHKGNYNRFLLSTYLLSVHNERDAKHQLDLMLDEEERTHMANGNCKDQWRTIVARSYPPPSPKTLIESGFAKGIEDCISKLIEEEEIREED